VPLSLKREINTFKGLKVHAVKEEIFGKKTV
jgi:hypothetical protein